MGTIKQIGRLSNLGALPRRRRVDHGVGICVASSCFFLSSRRVTFTPKYSSTKVCGQKLNPPIFLPVLGDFLLDEVEDKYACDYVTPEFLSALPEELLNSPENLKTTSEGADRVELDAELLKRSHYLVESFTGQSICVMKLVARPANVKELL